MESCPVPETAHSLFFRRALLPLGWAGNVRITVADGAVSAVETDAIRAPGEVDLGVALPGLSNVHSHAFQRAMAGLTEARGPNEGDDFWSWRALMYRFLDRGGPEEIEAITALAFAEMLEGGFTRVGEFHYLHNDPDGRAYADRGELAGRIAAAAEEAGIALTLLPVFYAHAGFGGTPPAHGQRRFINDIDGFAKLMDESRKIASSLPDAVVGVAPHSLRAVTPEEIAAVVPMADGGPVHIHAAEQTREVQDCLEWSGARPVQWLLDNVGLDRRWCLIHATHLTADETARMARSGAVAGLCPVTEANLGDGVFPAVDFFAEGGAFGVGTDSNVLIDAAGELRALEYSQRLTRRGRAVLADKEASTGGTLYRRALAGGAQATNGTTGIAVGQAADFVSLETDDLAYAGRTDDALLDSLVFAGPKRAIRTVWRRGRVVVENGRHVGREAIEARYRRALDAVLGG
ncbi:formimidoylglutamate deiminase [Brevundimonas sp. M20]|nr:formimidoylglutamate deiminase [Brevundimonas sp. M20]QDH73674.1 formimidoylglutamate deiminase [Brevundimonas sp. M20]